jgi:predicted MFS family arabinose efflux permease
VLLAPLAGALVDRWDRQRLLVATQLLAMLQAVWQQFPESDKPQ